MILSGKLQKNCMTFLLNRLIRQEMNMDVRYEYDIYFQLFYAILTFKMHRCDPG